ncbi:kinase, PfkB family [Klebsiella pneumoniae]|uniref:Kinase, PfkB family n=1 Tax=Klebsiella pneumoniae TaxID=573 RepID=A0A2X3F0T6_KLEPN|nr:kinase, PfkB family [Klebsiella pneumoniae]
MQVLDKVGVKWPHCLQVAGENGCAQLKIEEGERIFLGSNAGGIRKTTSMDFIFQHEQYLREFDLIHSGCYSYMETHLPQLRELNIPVSFDFSDDFVLEQALPLCRYVDFAFFSCADYSLAQTREIVQQAQASGSRIVCATRGDEGAILLTGRIGISRRPITSLPSIQWVQVMLLLPLSFAIFWPNLRVTSAKRLPRACKKQQLSRHKFA